MNLVAETGQGAGGLTMIMDVWGSVSQEFVSLAGPMNPLTAFRPRVISPPKAAWTQSPNLISMPPMLLIADDNDDNRELLFLLLSGAGYDVREARDGRECLAIARDAAPDLIVIDLSMPVLDGWGLFRELRSDGRTSAIPCMAVSAHAELNRNQALDAGFNAYVSKPYNGDALLKTVVALLENGKQIDEG
jgi:CheY-like chemotaxis protein